MFSVIFLKQLEELGALLIPWLASRKTSIGLALRLKILVPPVSFCPLG
jgi:hypothetical protein